MAFRLAVAGSSDSGKTTMIINLLMGDKKAKENGNRYVLCDAVLLVGRYLDEPKWAVVHDFFEEEKIPFTAVTHSEIPEIDSFDPTQATVVIFEDLMDAPKKIQDLITGYFTHGRHKNISCIYVAQRFFAIPKAIREKSPVIDDLTLQREFVVFDLRRSKSDPLSIRFNLILVPMVRKLAVGLQKTETLKTENVKELFSRYEALKATWTVEHYK
ncbi:hypothetical protein GLOIN_2v1874888 [Rhizophagus irregularis DAOM 181602=DAOM 197198]|nr:hypothetical protein GLOIN_2v1874888 [Rhizophagus irregularis DAOM 181602=DAOM 197198]